MQHSLLGRKRTELNTFLTLYIVDQTGQTRSLGRCFSWRNHFSNDPYILSLVHSCWAFINNETNIMENEKRRNVLGLARLYGGSGLSSQHSLACTLNHSCYYFQQQQDICCYFPIDRHCNQSFAVCFFHLFPSMTSWQTRWLSSVINVVELMPAHLDI